MYLSGTVKLWGYRFFCSMMKTQDAEGVNSYLTEEKREHYILIDHDGTTLEQVQTTLRHLQLKYDLSTFYVMSDQTGSYRSFCFNSVDFQKYVHILVDSKCDRKYLINTLKRGYATLRISDKQGREPNRVVAVIKSYDVGIPERFSMVDYETPLSKDNRDFKVTL